MRGYIYILSNPSMPDVLKIGMSKHGGAKRATDLYTTGVPTPFKLEFEIFTEDSALTEQSVHESLEQCRVDSRREFFALEVFEAIEVVAREALASYDLTAERSEVTEAYDNCVAFAEKMNVHPVMIGSAIRFLDYAHVCEAYDKYQVWTARRIKEIKAERGDE